MLCTAACAPGQHVLPAFIPPPRLSCFYLSLLNPSVPILSVCVFVWMMTQSEAFDTVQKKDDENQGEMPQHSLKSDLRWQTLRPQRMMPHMLTVLPCCCVEALGNDTLQGRKMCFPLNMQPFSYKMFSLTSRRPCCLSLKDFWSQNIIHCNTFICLSPLLWLILYIYFNTMLRIECLIYLLLLHIVGIPKYYWICGMFKDLITYKSMIWRQM